MSSILKEMRNGGDVTGDYGNGHSEFVMESCDQDSYVHLSEDEEGHNYDIDTNDLVEEHHSPCHDESCDDQSCPRHNKGNATIKKCSKRKSQNAKSDSLRGKDDGMKKVKTRLSQALADKETAILATQDGCSKDTRMKKMKTRSSQASRNEEITTQSFQELLRSVSMQPNLNGYSQCWMPGPSFVDGSHRQKAESITFEYPKMDQRAGAPYFCALSPCPQPLQMPMLDYGSGPVAEFDSKTDPLEEDKRKARALRFSNSSPKSLSQVNGEGNIEPKAAIAGKAGGGT